MKKTISKWEELHTTSDITSGNYIEIDRPCIYVFNKEISKSYIAAIDYKINLKEIVLIFLHCFGFDITFQEPLSEDEILELKYAKAIGLNYIARDDKNSIKAHELKPKRYASWCNGERTLQLILGKYRFIEWTDDPMLIDNLIGVSL
jgi:hypothetical protein